MNAAADPASRWWRLLTMPVLAALASGIGVYAAGAPLWRAGVAAVTIGATGWLLLRALVPGPDTWPDPPADIPVSGRIPRNWEVVGLDAALARPEFLSRRILDRIVGIATEVLDRRGIPLDSPQGRQLLGARNFQLLTDPKVSPRKGELGVLIDTVVAIGVDPSGPRPIRIARRLVPRGRRSTLLRSRPVRTRFTADTRTHTEGTSR